ncbi:MAG: hypothetical protein AAB482_02695 [Patescibacteria group bacterium]
MALNSFQTPQAPQKKSFLPMILILVVVMILAGGGYWYFKLRENTVQSDAVSEDIATQSASAVSVISDEDQAKVEAITQAVATLKTLNLDIKFFEDSRFTSLKETEIIIPDIFPPDNYKHPFEFIKDALPAPEVVSSSKKK